MTKMSEVHQHILSQNEGIVEVFNQHACSSLNSCGFRTALLKIAQLRLEIDVF